MTFYIYSPAWFSGIDSILELITIFTSILISIYSYKTYKIFGIRKYKYFSLTFFLLGISFIAKIISNLIFIVPIKREITMHFYTIIYTTYQNMTYIEDIASFVHKVALLVALLILFFIITSEKKIETIILTSSLVLTIAYLIENYLLFNFFIILISMYLFLNSYMKDRIRNKKRLSNLTYFFFGIALSYLFLLFAIAHSIFYFIGEVVLAITFSFMLYSFIKVFKQ